MMQVGNRKVTKVLIGSDVVFNNAENWQEYAVVDKVKSGKLLYQWLGDNIYLQGILSTETGRFHINAPKGYRFTKFTESGGVQTSIRSNLSAYANTPSSGNSTMYFGLLVIENAGLEIAMHGYGSETDANGSLLFIGVTKIVEIEVEKIKE